MKKIFVSQRGMREERYGEERDAIDRRWYELCGECGLLPVLLPNHLATAKTMLSSMPEVQGFLITGGNDFDTREQAEHYVLNECIKKKWPVLGVCHGMQVIQRHFGLEIVPVPNHVSHAMQIDIDGKKVTVNSYHNLGTHHTVQELTVWAKAPDGVIKAVRHTLLPIVGVMWHPERCLPFSSEDIARIKTHFSSAS